MNNLNKKRIVISFWLAIAGGGGLIFSTFTDPFIWTLAVISAVIMISMILYLIHVIKESKKQEQENLRRKYR